VKFSSIIVDPTIQIRRNNHEATIQRYVEAFDKLPPVTVIDSPEGMLLADGFHRMAAAGRLGLEEIEAKVIKGTREDALEIAVVANMKNADPLSPEERDDGIRRLRQLHPDHTLRQIAETMSVSYETVRRVFQVDEVKREVVTPVTRVTTSHYREVAAAPKEQWEPLIKAADERGWSRDATAQAVRNLKDDRIPAERKKDILAGKADPVVFTPEGEAAIPADVVGRRLRDMAANDAVLQLERALAELAKLRLFGQAAIAGTAGGERLDRLIDEMPGYIKFMQDLLNEAEKARRKLEVVQ